MPWSVLRGERAPTDRWSSRDRLLAVALIQLEASLCSGCGQPQWLAFEGDEQVVQWDIPEAPLRCHPCTVRDQVADEWMRRQGRDENGEVEVPARHALRWPITPVRPGRDEE